MNIIVNTIDDLWFEKFDATHVKTNNIWKSKFGQKNQITMVFFLSDVKKINMIKE